MNEMKRNGWPLDKDQIVRPRLACATLVIISPALPARPAPYSARRIIGSNTIAKMRLVGLFLHCAFRYQCCQTYLWRVFLATFHGWFFFGKSYKFYFRAHACIRLTLQCIALQFLDHHAIANRNFVAAKCAWCKSIILLRSQLRDQGEIPDVEWEDYQDEEDKRV